MKPFGQFLLTVLILAGAGYAVFVWLGSRQHAAQPVTAVQAPPIFPTASPTASPTIQYPVPTPTQSFSTAEKQAPIPTSVDQSDSSIAQALGDLFGKDRFDSLFIARDIIRRIVVTIDNTTRERQTSEDMWPVNPPSPGFLVSGAGNELSISPENYRRYQPYVDLVRDVDVPKLISIYQRFYPLFQTAYRDLGTKGYLNDRVVAVIDHLLQTPDLVGSIRVVRGAHGRYHYADLSMEALSSGQKILIRMGYENMLLVKSKLREIRANLTQLR